MTISVFRHIAHKFSWIIALFALLASCTDERLGGGIRPETDNEEKVKVTFSLNVPGLMTPTRATDGVDEQIETIDLFLFDEDDLLTEVVHLTKEDATNGFTENDEQYENGEYTTLADGTTGTYTAWIDGNTSHIHFIANLKEGEFDFKEHEGASETEAIAPLITQNRVYWGRATFDGTNLSQNPVMLYRNYAKVKVGEVASGITINGWTLYHRPVYGTMAPCDRSKLSGSSTGEQDSFNPFDFTLGTSDVSLPLAGECLMTGHNTENQAVAESEITASSANVAYWCFEYAPDEFEDSKPVYAIFNITQNVSGTPVTRYYKIDLLYDAEKDGYGNVTQRLPFTIKRNHEYTINFEGLSHETGWETFDEAVNHDPANNTEITIEESVPEIVSANHTLRIEETAEGSSTVRYYKDYTDPETTYTIDDILIYYDGDDCTTNAIDGTQGANSLNVTWQGDAPAGYVEGSLAVSQATDAGGVAIAHTYRISFQVKGFADSESLDKHYTEGTLCIAEQHEKLLKRYVKVYVGPAITFRPLLISSDIPNLTDERLTILFTIPDGSYLPADLYPIEIRFGSDRVDVEKNLYVDAMKVDFGADAAENYTHVLRWQGTSAESTDWKWTSSAANTVTNSWGYKYIYTLETPPTANEAQQRITLRTVVTGKDDFKVLMEGRSTVTGTNVFNTRELDFMMQNDGSATFDIVAGSATYGSWIEGTVGSSDQYKRIMLDDGLPETRYATRYVNIAGDISLQNVEFTIPYTLGTLADGAITADTETGTTPTLWVHYDNSRFAPTTSSGKLGTAQTDANGNTFVAVTPAEGSATGSVTFRVLNQAKNSMIFFTARNQSKYGEYNATTFIDGNVGYAYTGVNELATTYRSAGALVSTISKWDFNPAPSVTDGNYSFADQVSIPSGKDQDLYVRIDRPRATETVITIDTKGMLALQEAPHQVSVSGSEVPDYTFVQNADGTYTVTLASAEQDYAYLHFHTTGFSSAGTICFSGNIYNDAELTITNASIPFLAFEYAQEEELVKDEPTYATGTNVIPAIKGALIGVRVYLPKALYTAMNAGTDSEKSDEEIFRFSFTSRNFEPVNADSELLTVLGTQSRYDYYTVAKSSKNNTTYIITVKEGALHEGQDITTAEGKVQESCYIDILLQSTVIESAENVKFQGTNEAVSDLSFYPYNTAIACSGTYEVTIEQSADGTEWITTPLSGIKDGKAVYYRITIPDWGPSRKDLPMLIQHNGKLVIPEGSTLTDVWDGDDNTFIFNATTQANAETQVVFQLEKEGDIAAGTQEAIQIVPAKDRVKLASPKLMMTELLAVTPTSVAIYSAKTDEEKIIYENGASLEQPYLDLPVDAAGVVNVVIDLGETYNDEEFTLTMTSSDNNAVGLVPQGITTSQGKEITATAIVTDGKLTFELQTLYAGTAEVFTINVKSDEYILPELTQLMATSATEAGAYNVWWTQPSGHARGLKNGEGNEIFDNQQTQNALHVPTSVGTLASPYESYTHGIKFDGSGYISFYAPKDEMTLSVVVGENGNNVAGTLGIYKADGTQLNVGNDGEGVIDLDGTVITQTLEESGLYYLKRSSNGNAFIVYALTLSLPAASFGDFKWYATKTDEEAVSRGSGTWGAADALVTATDADSDGTLDVWVSDFAQELHMTVDGLNDGETTLTISGAYKFKDGETTQTVTPTGNAVSLTLVPVTYFDTGNELVDGSFTLSGISSHFSYTAKTVDVNIRPWVLLTTNVEEYADVFKDGNGYGVLIPYMNTYEMSFTVKDQQHEGKNISFEPRLTYNGSTNAGDSYFRLLSFPGTEKGNDWQNGYSAEFESAAYDSPYTFVWRAIEQGTNSIHQVKEGAYTDIIVKDENGHISEFSSRNHIYYAHTASGQSVSRLRPLAPFMNADALQGYIQYSTDGGNTWQYVLGNNGENLNVHLNGHISQVHMLPVGKFHMRVTIPTSIGDDDYSYIAVKSGSTVNNNFTNQGIVTDDNGCRWVKFEVDASSASHEETWSNLVFYDNREVPEVGPSAIFNLKFENESLQFNGISSYSTASSLGNSVSDNIYSDTTPAENDIIPVKAFTNQITLKVAVAGDGNNGSTPTISSSNYTLSSATYADGYWTLVLGVTNLVDEDITISCDGYSNTQTASINVRPYVTANINSETFNGGDQMTITVNVVTVGNNKPVSFKIEDRGNLTYVDSDSFVGSGGTYTLSDHTWTVDLGNLSAGTYTYTYTLYANNTACSNQKFVVSSNSVDCYNGSDRFDASISLNYAISRVEDVYELYDADGTGSGLMTVFKNGVSTNETVIVTNDFSDEAIAGASHRSSSVSVYLFDSQNGIFSTEQTELVNGSKLGSGQTVTLNIKYPTKMTIIYGNKVAGSSIKVGNDILPSPTTANEVMTTTDYELQRGTYTISRSADEGRLWYLMLSPQ